jgi:hypothetical protein
VVTEGTRNGQPFRATHRVSFHTAQRSVRHKPAYQPTMPVATDAWAAGAWRAGTGSTTPSAMRMPFALGQRCRRNGQPPGGSPGAAAAG